MTTVSEQSIEAAAVEAADLEAREERRRRDREAAFLEIAAMVGGDAADPLGVVQRVREDLREADRVANRNRVLEERAQRAIAELGGRLPR